MKLKQLFWVGIYSVAFIFWGEIQFSFAAAGDQNYEQKQTVEITENPTDVKAQNNPLSNIMVKPKLFPMAVEHDPFAPLVKPKKVEIAIPTVEEQEADLLMGMRYQGMVKMGETYSVLLHTPDGKGVYQINDQINGLTITAIDESSVTLTKGARTVKLKRGDL